MVRECGCECEACHVRRASVVAAIEARREGIREGEQRERARVVAELERRIDEHTASAVRHRDLGNTGWAQKDERSARTLEGMLKFVRGDHEGTKGGGE